MAFSPRLTNGIAVVIVTAWSGSIIADALLPAYDPPLSVHAAMMGVVGAAFGASVIRKAPDASNDRRNNA